MVTDTLQTATDPVGGAVPTVTDTLQSVGDSGGTLTDSVSTITDTFQRETDSVVNALPIQTVDHTVQGSTDPVQTITDSEVQRMGGTLDQATDPLQQTVGDPVGTVSGTVQQTAGDPVQTVTIVQQTTNDPVQTVGQTVQPVTGATEPVAGATQPMTSAVQQAGDAVQPAAGAVDGATQTGSSIVDTSAATAGGAVDTAVKHGGGALAGAGDGLHTTAEQIAGGTPISQNVTTLMSGTGAPAPTPAPTDLAPAIPSHLPEHVASGPLGLTDVSPPVSSGDGGLLDGLPFHGPGMIPGGDEVLMATAAAITVASVAIAVRPSTVATAEFFLANARQIPAVCGGVREGVNRQISAAAAGSTHLVELAAQAPDRAAAALDDASKAIRENFHRGFEGGVLGRDTGGTGDGERDIRFLMQIGMLLGAVYVAFLTVWFWATRLRWNPRT